MPYKILPIKEFVKDFKRLDNFIKENKEKDWRSCGKSRRYKHMHYDFSGSCRIRIGKIRIIFSYSKEKDELYPEKIIFDHKYKE